MARLKSGGRQLGSYGYRPPPIGANKYYSQTKNIKHGQTTTMINIQQEIGEGLRHRTDCTSNLGAMDFDTRCTRCIKIKTIIFLRRKTVENGASEGEQAVALTKANDLRLKFKITRGEVFDRTYESPPTKRETVEGAFKQSATKRGKRTTRTARWAANIEEIGL